MFEVINATELARRVDLSPKWVCKYLADIARGGPAPENWRLKVEIVEVVKGPKEWAIRIADDPGDLGFRTVADEVSVPRESNADSILFNRPFIGTPQVFLEPYALKGVVTHLVTARASHGFAYRVTGSVGSIGWMAVGK